MTRKTKRLIALAIALFAVGAISTMAGAEEGKQGELESDGLFTLSGTEEGAENFLTIGEEKLECKTASFTGEKEKGGQFAATGEKTITIHPKYDKCTLGENPATIESDCDYLLHLGETEAGGEKYKSTMDLVCTKEGFKVKVYKKGSTEHKAGELECVYRIEPQTNRPGSWFKNAAGGKTITLGGSFEELNTVLEEGCEGENITSKRHITVIFEGKKSCGAETEVKIKEV